MRRHKKRQQAARSSKLFEDQQAASEEAQTLSRLRINNCSKRKRAERITI